MIYINKNVELGNVLADNSNFFRFEWDDIDYKGSFEFSHYSVSCVCLQVLNMSCNKLFSGDSLLAVKEINEEMYNSLRNFKLDFILYKEYVGTGSTYITVSGYNKDLNDSVEIRLNFNYNVINNSTNDLNLNHD